MSSSDPDRSPSRGRKTLAAAALFGALWLPIGFATGTGVLLGPVRALADAARAGGWSPAAENGAVGAVILLFVIGSAAASGAAARWVRRTVRPEVRWGLPSIAVVLAGASLWMWMNPALAAQRGRDDTRPGSHFTFGPYPDETKLAELEAAGYTAVIPLLHPAVVPFEPKLLAEEREAAARIGIELIHLPMLPWVSDNLEAIEALRDLARKGGGKYYVHCYLGQDRVQIAKRAVESVEGGVGVDAQTSARRLEDLATMERGAYVKLAESAYLTPYPTDDEWVGYVLAGGFRTVVSLLDAASADDRPWIEAERALLGRHGIDLVELPFERLGNRERAEAVARVAALPRPILIHAFLGPTSGKSEVSAAFWRAWRDHVPIATSRKPDPPPAAASVPAAGAVPRPRSASVSVVLLLPFAVLAVFASTWWVGRLRTVAGVRTPYTRKIFHFVIFTFAAVTHAAAGLPGVIAFGSVVSAAVLYATWRGDGFPFYEALARSSDAPRRSLFVLVPLATTAVGGLLSNVLFGPLAVVGYLVGGWGDAIGEPVGTAFGRHRFQVPSLGGVRATRSIEGSAAVALAGIAAAATALVAVGIHPAVAIAAGSVCGLAGCAVEAISPHGLDNLTIQVVASGVAWIVLG